MRIDGCDISTGDDCIAIKSGRGTEAYALLQTTEDVLITNCTMADSIFACIGIGSETSGGIRNVRIEHCKFTARADLRHLHQEPRGPRRVHRRHFRADDLDVSAPRGGFLRVNALSQRDSG